MQLQAIALPGFGPAVGGPGQEALPPGMLDAVVRTVLTVMAAQQPTASTPADDRPDLPALLSPAQTAEVLGVDRNTVDRMVKDEDLPSIVLREGAKQKMVRIPKAFVLRMLATLNAGVSIPDVKRYSRQWQASAAIPVPAQGEPETAGVA